jgi:hypothetical protein
MAESSLLFQGQHCPPSQPLSLPLPFLSLVPYSFVQQIWIACFPQARHRVGFWMQKNEWASSHSCGQESRFHCSVCDY